MLKKIALGIFVLLLVAAGVFTAWHWTFISRIATYPHDAPVTNVAWYQPLRTVPGRVGSPMTLDSKNKTFSPEVLNRISEYAFRNNSSALLVQHNGKLVLEKYWYGHEVHSMANAMSMTKPVVALLIGIAIDEGKIRSLDDSISRYIPELKNDARSKITVRQMLTMTSGLRRWTDIRDPRSDLLQLHFGTDVNALALSVPSVEAPGTRFVYNNINTQLLSVLLMRATGRDFVEYLSEKLWKPLGATTAGIWLDRPGGNARTYCCMFSTARDWIRVGQLFLDKGQIEGRQVISQKWIEKMVRPSKLMPDYGLHIFLGRPGGTQQKFRDEEFVVNDLYYLKGKFKQFVFIIPSQKLVIVRVGEKPNKWSDSLIPNALVRDLTARNAVTKRGPDKKGTAPPKSPSKTRL